MTMYSLIKDIIENLVNDHRVKSYIGDPEGIAHYYTYGKFFKNLMAGPLEDIYNWFQNKDLFFDAIDYELEDPDVLSLYIGGYDPNDISKYVEIVEKVLKSTATSLQEDKRKGILYINFTIPDLLTIEEMVKEKLSEKLYNMNPLVNDMELWNKVIRDIDVAYL